MQVIWPMCIIIFNTSFMYVAFVSYHTYVFFIILVGPHHVCQLLFVKLTAWEKKIVYLNVQLPAVIRCTHSRQYAQKKTLSESNAVSTFIRACITCLYMY